MTKKEEIAWAAGIYEGEGSIGFYNGIWRIQVANTNLEVLHRFQAIVNVGSIRQTKRYQLHHKTCYRWETGREADIWLVVELFWNILSARRQDQVLDSIIAREEHIGSKKRECIKCGCDWDEETPGCSGCYFRHWRRRRA